MMKKTLKPGGKALIKVMRGPSIAEVIEAYLGKFNTVIKVKPSASRAESNELYLLANGYEQSQQDYVIKRKQQELQIQNLKTMEDLENFEKSVSEEGKQIAENILRDLRNKGEDITLGMKKALVDLGIDEKELKEPPMTKSRYLEKMRKKAKHEKEIEDKFERKYGIKRKFKGMKDEKLHETAGKIEDELDAITEEEKNILEYTNIEYDEETEYQYPDFEDPEEHLIETYERIT